MTETLIVDGYNIIHAIPDIERELNEDLASARKALTAALRKYQAGEKSICRIYVVYDGRGEGGQDIEDMGLIKNIYTSKEVSADAEIVNMLKAAGGLNKTAVMSQDNFVVNHARAMGANILSVNRFFKKIAGKKRASASAVLSDNEKADINKELKKIWGIK